MIKDKEAKPGPPYIETQKILARRQSENRPWKNKDEKYPYCSSLAISDT